MGVFEGRALCTQTRAGRASGADLRAQAEAACSSSEAPDQVGAGARLGLADVARRALLLALFWLGLNGTDHASWILGAPVVLAAAALSAWLPGPPAPRVRWAGVPGFAAGFALRSVSGGWDVARRALGRRLDLAPGFVRFETRLPPGAPRVLFAWTVSLLPGTLVAGVEDRSLTIHALDATGGLDDDLRSLERRVAALFLPAGDEGGDAPC